jgi:hypothetical protein
MPARWGQLHVRSKSSCPVLVARGLSGFAF